jgi:uncharacterized membrane protein YfcA
MALDFQTLLGLAAPLGLFLAVGFLAQLVDGALGMAYGVISSTALLSFGVPPAQASAMIHAAECVTTAASGTSHLAHRNVDWSLFWRLAPAGIGGGVLGAYVITGFDQTLVKSLVIAYLAVLGVVILSKALRRPADREPHLKHVAPLGMVGGFLDASGGGGWGPIVASTLMGRGHTPRYVIGTVNTVEFFVTAAISVAFIVSFLTGRFEIEGGPARLGMALLGLLIGGVLAAPLAGHVTKILPSRILMGAVGALVLALSIWQGVQLWPRLLDTARAAPHLSSLLTS